MRTVRVRNMAAPAAVKSKGLNKEKRQFKKSTFVQERRYFAWGRVTKRRSDDCTIDALLDSGIKLTHVNVRSTEWAGSGTADGFGERDLPPEDSLVLIAFPYGTLEDAIVLCSAFTLFGIHTTKQQSNLLTSGKETERFRKTESGIQITENKTNGDLKLELPTGAKLEIIANNAKIEITAAGGVKVTPATGQSVTLNNGTRSANDYPNCLFTGALHCLDPLSSVKVP